MRVFTVKQNNGGALNFLGILERFVDLITMSIFLIIFLLGSYAIFDVQKMTKTGELSEDLAVLAPDENTNDEIDLVALKKINPEIVGWIRIHDTKIDYPIVQAKNNTKYLSRGYDGNYAPLGGIFLDYRNNGFSDDFSIIYGHRVDGELMFGALIRFEDEDYFNKHRTGTLYTENGTFDLELTHFAILDVNTTKIYSHDANRNGHNSSVIAEISGASIHSHNVKLSQDDRLLALSTCNKDSKHYRDVLLTKMIPRFVELETDRTGPNIIQQMYDNILNREK